MFNCLFCGKENEDSKNTKSKYCNNQCQSDHQYKVLIDEWKSGKIVIRAGGRISRHLRRYLFEKYKSQCSRCGWHEINPITAKSPLEVEHIDGNSENNVETNLTLLCPNCHSITPTYKALNRGHGRHARMTRYKTGKSF